MTISICTDQCSGCQACGNVCPQNAIAFLPNEEGFLYPQINLERCVECGLCVKVCPQYGSDKMEMPRYALAAVAKDSEFLKNSSSGAIFAVLATHVLMEGGYVFGAAMHENYVVRHICISDISQLHRLQGSKYVQSDMTGVYEKLSELLRSGKTVLFSGTPCQVAGVQKAMKEIAMGNLITVDIVCHGVPSPLFFREHIAAAYGDVKDVRFRHRTKYELSCFAMGYLKNGKKHLVQPTDKDAYYACYSSNVSLRECCYTCRFANPARLGDLTLGDLGSSNAYEHILGDDRALSLIAVNTEKGNTLLRSVQNELDSTEADYLAEVKINKQLSAPMKRPEGRDAFYRELFENSYSEVVATKYGKKPSAKEMLRNVIIYHVPQQTRKRLKRIIRKVRG